MNAYIVGIGCLPDKKKADAHAPAFFSSSI